MKTNLLFIMLIALITFSCRTMKQTSTIKDEVKTVANLDIKQSIDAKSTVDSSSITLDKSVTNSLVSEIITITNLSKPDSIGKQYPVQTTVINRTTDNKKVGDLKTESKINSTNEKKSTINDKSNSKSDSISTNINTEESKTKTPAWIYFFTFFAIIIAGVFIYTRFK
jgi:hypothetical protein